MRSLDNVLKAKGIPYKTIPGEAAFYGPKIDVKLVDVLGRLWQLSTVQFDFNLPGAVRARICGRRRRAASAGDGASRAVRIGRAILRRAHRALCRAFPLWLAPVQIGLVPISERHLAYAEKVEAELKAAGFRVEIDARNEKMNAKIRDFANQKIPYILVFGDKEEAAGSVSVRTRGKGDQGSMPLGEFIC